MIKKNAKTVKIEDLAEVHSGVTLRKRKEESDQIYAILKREDLDGYLRLNTKNLSFTREIKPKNRHLLSAGDIIFSSKGEYNFATVIPEDLGPAVAASTFLVLKNIQSDVLPKYLAWYINSKTGQDYLLEVRKRTSIPYVSKSKFVEMPVTLPPINTQKLIAKVDGLKIKELKLRKALTEHRKELIEAILHNHVKKKAPSGLEID